VMAHDVERPTGPYTIEVTSPCGKWLGHITIEPGPVRRGQLVAARDECGVLDFGKLVGVGRQHVTLLAPGSGRRTRYPATSVEGRVVEVTRAEDAAMRPKAEVKPKADPKIEALRERLSELDEAHDESARFRILREIYDLERASPVDPADEWPEYIYDRRAA
jgi:hypothetical protein